MNTTQSTSDVRTAGFTLYLAIVVVGILLYVGYAVSNVGFKQTQFTSTAEASRIAINAAESGIECALFWDVQEDKYPRPDDQDYTKVSDINCNDNKDRNYKFEKSESLDNYECDANNDGTDNSCDETTFKITGLGQNGEACAETVTVLKEEDGERVYTAVEAVGWSDCSDGERNVERTIEIFY